MGSCILVIEPDGYTAAQLERTLGKDGYRIHHEREGRRGLARARELRPEITILDHCLADVDGRSLLEEVRACGVETSVVMVSSQRNLGAVVACMRLGALDFIEKPFHTDDFLLSLRRVEERVRLQKEVRKLRRQVEQGSPYQLFFGNGEKMRDLQAIVDQIADTDITVLLRGESGTGKDLLARTIWQCSSRRAKPFVKINCAALPRELLESELFGYNVGAFTGATHVKPGKFEYAEGGVVFLDEVTEMHIDLQAKLLHVLQDGEVCRLGADAPLSVDVRIIAATNQDVEQGIQARKFRNDLFFRLNVVNIVIPPLRDRVEELPQLVAYFGEKLSEQYKRPEPKLPEALLEAMKEYRWPGNVRELENYMRRIVVLGDVDGVLQEVRSSRRTESLAGSEAAPTCFVEDREFDGKTLKEVAKLACSRAERVVLERVLNQTRWNRRKAASMLDISYKALLYKIQQTGLE
jgi:two-component system, NtrC family, response regulator AtoC